jgi:predicted dehydrogenase
VQNGRRVGVGVVGAGLVAQVVHLPYLAELSSRYELSALVEPDERVRRTVADRFGIGTVCADHRALLEREVVDALVICSPNASHAGVVLDALAAGVHVLVEKPLCLTVADADRIVEARDRTGLVVQVGCMKRFDPAYEALLDDLERSPPGQLLHVSTLTYDPGLAGPFAPPEPPGRNGATVDVRSEFFMGALVHDVNAVHGILERLGIASPGTVVDGFSRADGSAAGGTIALGGALRWHMAWLRVDELGDFREHIGLYGALGVRELGFPAPYLRQAPTAYRRSDGAGGANVTRTFRSWRESYASQLIHFHDCIARGVQCRTPPEQARTDIACLAALWDAVSA